MMRTLAHDVEVDKNVFFRAIISIAEAGLAGKIEPIVTAPLYYLGKMSKKINSAPNTAICWLPSVWAASDICKVNNEDLHYLINRESSLPNHKGICVVIIGVCYYHQLGIRHMPSCKYDGEEKVSV